MSHQRHSLRLESINIPLLEDFRSRKEWESVAWRIIVKHLMSAKSQEEFDAYFKVILSPNEKGKMLMRAVAMDRIKRGMNYRDISSELLLSSQTVSAIKKSLRDQVYRSYYNRGKTERKKRVYSRDLSPRSARRLGRRQKTKYGTLRMPL
jgi:uncharacterized protein YerC